MGPARGIDLATREAAFRGEKPALIRGKQTTEAVDRTNYISGSQPTADPQFYPPTVKPGGTNPGSLSARVPACLSSHNLLSVK